LSSTALRKTQIHQRSPLFSSPISRCLAATLGALLASVLTTAGMPVYLPFAQLENIGIPIVLFPVTWLVLFLYSVMSESMWRVWLLLAILTLGHAALIFHTLS